jgi:hypothetical protein
VAGFQAFFPGRFSVFGDNEDEDVSNYSDLGSYNICCLDYWMEQHLLG